MAIGLISGALTRDLLPPGLGQVIYRPNDVRIVVGATPITGFASGTFITARRNKPTWKTIKDCDGPGIRIRTNDYSATISLKLRQGSPSNDFLSSLILADEISGELAVPMTVQHIPGRSIYVSSFTSIEGPPPMAFGTDENDVPWTFLSDNWQPFTGGFNPIRKEAPFLGFSPIQQLGQG